MAKKEGMTMSKTALFGYSPRKVNMYMERLEQEASFLERRQQEQSEAFMSMQAELQRQIAEAEGQLSEMEAIETNLKQWIQRNQSSA